VPAVWVHAVLIGRVGIIVAYGQRSTSESRSPASRLQHTVC
jgi:hypothetical protein